MAVIAQCGGLMLGDTLENVGGQVTIKPMANQAASEETTSPTVAEFNALLAKLKAAGFMEADA